MILASFAYNPIYISQYFFEDVFVLLNIHVLILERPGQILILKKKDEEKIKKSLKKAYSSECLVFNMLALRMDFSCIK